ncbi:hypothetical protein CBS147347_11449 [Aspergillus niger]|nr:hypothetical protein CBS147347_11449 [Aspergillus niger]
MARIDTYTVEKLQLHAPRASNNDKNHVEGKILSGEVFSSFSESERRIIRNKLMSAEACDGIIPSLATFFHDISYLKLCADAVKRLVRLDGKHPTVRGALVHYFRKRARGDTTCFIQTSESTFRRQLGSEEERLAMGYRQIWMYAMRHYPAMARDIKDEARSKMAQAKGEARPDEHVVYNMALLAEKLGFHTPQINVILEQSPDLQIAADALLRARKPAEYTYDDETMKRLMRKIARCFAHATPKEMRHVNTTTGQADKLHERRGAPPKAVQPLDCPHLFLDRLHSPIMRRNVLSSLEVRRSVYYAFFGKPPSRGDSSDPGSYSPLFFPNRASDVQPEASSRNVSRSSSGTRSLQDGQPRSDTREERRRRRHGRNNQERERGLHQQQQEVSQLFPSEGPLLRRSSAVPPVIYRDSLDTFDTEFQIRSQRNSQRPAAGEDNRTAREQRGLLEVYDDDLLHRTEDVSVRNLLDSEHEPMTALVPARPQEEGEEEEGLNSAMEKEHTQLYEDDISRDMHAGASSGEGARGEGGA